MKRIIAWAIMGILGLILIGLVIAWPLCVGFFTGDWSMTIVFADFLIGALLIGGAIWAWETLVGS